MNPAQPSSTESTAALDLSADVLEITEMLCDIPSVSGSEFQIAEAIETALRKFPHLSIHRHGNTVVVRTEQGRDQRVVIAGHLDTVPINKNFPSWRGDIAGEPYLFGRGTVDMKGGVAVQLKLAATLSTSIVDVTWIFYDNEEVANEFNGLGLLATAHPGLMEADFAVLCEPTNAMIEGGCNGSLQFEVSTSGLRAHSARAWKGRNAIHQLEPILNILNDYIPQDVEVDGLSYREGLNAVSISGGVASNVIPDAAKVAINYRFAPDKSAQEAENIMRDLFRDFSVTVLDSADGARPGLHHPLAQKFVHAIEAEVHPKLGWTDVARFSALGIPAVNYGPGDPSKAHADDEALRIADLYSCEKGLRGWLSYN